MNEGGPPDLLQRQARALGDPTRHAIFRLIEEAADAPGVRQLADALSLHHSAIRQHLAKLVGAELVVETRLQPVGPGRPRSVYSRAAGVVGVWSTDNPFERLAALLVDALRSGTSPRAAGREAGRAVARSEVVGPGAATRPALDVLTGLVAAQGFEPTLDETGDRPALVLGRCPYASLAVAAPEVVCELHRGLAEGMAEALPCGASVDVVGLTRVDPLAGGCRVELRPRASDFDSE